MQFKTKLGLVDIPNAEVLTAARDIAKEGSERIPVLMERIVELEDLLRSARCKLLPDDVEAPVVVNGQEHSILIFSGATYGDLLKAAIEQAHYRSADGWYVHDKQGKRLDLNVTYVPTAMGELFVSAEAGVGG